MNLKDKRRDMELRLLDKFPQYGDIIYSIIEEIEEQDKQAIKDLKVEIDNQIEAPNNWIGVGQAEILKEKINKIMGVWEE